MVDLGIPCKQHVIGEDGSLPPLAFENIDAIVNLAGENIAGMLWSARRKDQLVDSRVGLAEKIKRGVAESSRKKVPVFIGASAVGIYPKNADRADESTEAADDFLGSLCRDWESNQRAVPADRTVILRLGNVLGDGGIVGKQYFPIYFGRPRWHSRCIG